MGNRILAVAAGVLIVGSAALWFAERQRYERLKQENSALQQRAGDAEEALAKNKALTEQLQALEEREQRERTELVRLRGQAVKARQSEAEVARLQREQAKLSERLTQKMTVNPQRAATDSEAPEETPERRLLYDRLNLSRHWGIALLMFAEANGGKFPSDLASAAPYFNKEGAPSSVYNDFGIDQYELVYQGSIEGLTNAQHIILAREKTPTRMREDSYARTYLFVDGHSEILNAPTADGFEAREKQLNHVSGPQ